MRFQKLIDFAEKFIQTAEKNGEVADTKPENFPMHIHYVHYKQLTERAMPFLIKESVSEEEIACVASALRSRKDYTEKWIKEQNWNRKHITIFRKLSVFLQKYNHHQKTTQEDKVKQDESVQSTNVYHYLEMENIDEKVETISEICKRNEVERMIEALDSASTNVSFNVHKTFSCFASTVMLAFTKGMLFYDTRDYIQVLKIPVMVSEHVFKERHVCENTDEEYVSKIATFSMNHFQSVHMTENYSFPQNGCKQSNIFGRSLKKLLMNYKKLQCYQTSTQILEYFAMITKFFLLGFFSLESLSKRKCYRQNYAFKRSQKYERCFILPFIPR